MESTIKILRLQNGEYFIGEISETEDSFIVKNPEKIIMGAAPGQKGISLSFFNEDGFLSNDDEIEIVYKDVLYVLNPKEEIESNYKQLYNKVQIVTPKLQLP